MKRKLKLAALYLASGVFWAVFLLTCFSAVGCTPTTTTPAQLAPGYQNAADQQMGSILSGARAFYTSIQQQSAAGTLTLTPAVKQAFNTFGVSLNAAESVYLEYHALFSSGVSAADPTTTANLEAKAQAAVNTVQSQQAALPLPGATK
jgi:hypothetical protein